MQRSLLDAAEATPPANPFADPRPLTICPKCKSTRYRDRRIHEGQSIARECDGCGYAMGFPVWYGEETPER